MPKPFSFGAAFLDFHTCWYIDSYFGSLWQIAGIYPENFRLLKTDSSTDFALSPETLSKAISQDIASGLIPFFLCATVRKLGKHTNIQFLN